MTRFQPTQSHGNADGLSRLPLSDIHPVGNCEDPTVYNLAQLDTLPLQATDVIAATRTDPILSKVLHYTRRGFPEPPASQPSLGDPPSTVTQTDLLRTLTLPQSRQSKHAIRHIFAILQSVSCDISAKETL